MSTPFNANYYEDGIRNGLSLYENYRWLPDLTIPMAQALVAELGIKRHQYILDFGCAKGFLVKALRGLGYRAHGCDISDYALAHADPEAAEFLFHVEELDFCYDWIIAKDVLEHIPETELMATLRVFRAHCHRLFIAVPLGNAGQYTIPEMEKDVTHRIRRPLWWWAAMVEEAGFKKIRSDFSMPGVKENWTRKYKFGNGFITAE